MEFSVDMIRLQTIVNRSDIEMICKRMINVETNPYIKMYNKFGWKDYKYHFIYDDGVQNFWFAYDFALCDKPGEESRTFVIEYNPNKNQLTGTLLRLLKDITLYKRSQWIVKGGDIAIDLKGIKRDSVFYDRKYYKHTVEYIDNDSRTSYIGHRGWGATKIYDKAKEQGLNEDWTRVEFTVQMGFELQYFRAYNGDCITMTIPDITVIDYMSLDDIKLKAYFHLIASGLATANDFKRDIRKKLKETAISSSSIVIDNSIKHQLSTCMIAYLEKFVQILEIEAFPF